MELVVHLNRIYNNIMMNKIVIGDIISDGFEEGMVIGEEYDKGDKWWLVWDGKEAWKMHSREVKLINNIEGDINA